MILPKKLKKGDEIRIVAPARSLSLLTKEMIASAKAKIENQGFKVSFSKHCREDDIFHSSSVESRVSDLHDAFSDKNVKAIFTVLGGFNSNQLLSYLDYELIKENPKILCGFSDITALANAITAQTGLVTYSGLHFSTWGMEQEFSYNLEYFKKCVIEDTKFQILPSPTWSDDKWYQDQKNRNLIENDGFFIINKGRASGKVFGGNLCTFNLLQGTRFMPDISDALLFLEDDDIVGDFFPEEFERNLQSLIHQKNFETVKGIVIGRFQKGANMNMGKLTHIIKTKKELQYIPIIANVDFGHTNPLITFPIGGTAELIVDNTVTLRVLEH